MSTSNSKAEMLSKTYGLGYMLTTSKVPKENFIKLLKNFSEHIGYNSGELQVKVLNIAFKMLLKIL